MCKINLIKKKENITGKMLTVAVRRKTATDTQIQYTLSLQQFLTMFLSVNRLLLSN